LLINRLLKLIVRKCDKTDSQWDNIAIEAARRPLRMLVWLMGIFYAINIIADELKAGIFADILSLRTIAFVLMIGWSINRFIRHGANYYLLSCQKKGKETDYTTVHAVAKLLKIAVNISMVLIVMQGLGISIGGVLAFGGISGIAVGFAAKDMLANFFGALIIYFDKPFKVGDWICSPDKQIEGTVEEIGWRMTTIRTFDKRPLYVPNSVFTTISVENPSRMQQRRIYETIGIRYDDIALMDKITTDVKQMLITHPEIDESQTLMVNFNSFNASSCDFFVYTFTHTSEWVKFHAIKQDILLKIADIIASHNAEMAFPTQTLHVQTMPEPPAR
jgi:MscS family membrane protein